MSFGLLFALIALTLRLSHCHIINAILALEYFKRLSFHLTDENKMSLADKEMRDALAAGIEVNLIRNSCVSHRKKRRDNMHNFCIAGERQARYLIVGLSRVYFRADV
jgi:hypothetical protein